MLVRGLVRGGVRVLVTKTLPLISKCSLNVNVAGCPSQSETVVLRRLHSSYGEKLAELALAFAVGVSVSF